jgi:hypothetical protein
MHKCYYAKKCEKVQAFFDYDNSFHKNDSLIKLKKSWAIAFSIICDRVVQSK